MAKRGVAVHSAKWNKFKNHMRSAGSEGSVAVGILGNHDNEREDGEITNVELGTIHEFGLSSMPERSFIRATLDAERSQINALTDKIYKRFLREKISASRGLGLIGADVVGRIQQFITDDKVKPKTIKPEASDPTTLIDTGQLRQSITFEVRK